MEDIDVQKLAQLCRLEIPESELPARIQDFHQILGFLEALEALPTPSGEELQAHPLGLPPKERPDRVEASVSAEKALENAPDQEAGCFRVPSILAG